MREEQYGRELQRFVEQATEPITAYEMTKHVGCSKQRTYQWLAMGARDVIELPGRTARGAAQFKHVEGVGRGTAGVVRPGDPRYPTAYMTTRGAMARRQQQPQTQAQVETTLLSSDPAMIGAVVVEVRRRHDGVWLELELTDGRLLLVGAALAVVPSGV